MASAVSQFISTLRNGAGRVLDLVYPRSCAGCGQQIDREGYLCWDCLADAEKITRPYCEKCGDPVDGLVEGAYECSWCRKNRPEFVSARSVFRFGDAVMNMVHELKYHGGVHLVGPMAELLAGAVRSLYDSCDFDLVVGVPMHSLRERERGYNQAALLAKAVAGNIGVDCFNRSVKRVRQTGTQTALKAAARLVNVKDAFEVAHSDWLYGKSVLLVDDVITTGATVSEVARVLRRAGAASVHAISIARG